MSKSELLVRGDRNAGHGQPSLRVTPESAKWEYIGFEVVSLGAGDSFRFCATGKETTTMILEGTCDVTVGEMFFAGVGGRQSVFDNAPPEAVYGPPDLDVVVRAQVPSEVAIASAITSEGVGAPRHIRAAEIPFERRGSGSTERFIHHILDEHHPAQKLLLVEVVTPAGNWSSFPPHKHDTEDPGQEAYLEETYYYRIEPNHGQAMQRVYDKQGLDEVVTPGNGDLVLVPRGYHPVAAPPGFRTYYLNVMAGHQRVWKYRLDSDYQHVAPKDGNIMGEVQG